LGGLRRFQVAGSMGEEKNECLASWLCSSEIREGEIL